MSSLVRYKCAQTEPKTEKLSEKKKTKLHEKVTPKRITLNNFFDLDLHKGHWTF